MNEMESACKYCCNSVDIISANWLTCVKCVCNIHVTCLKRQSVPGGVHGDVFFVFTCAECSENDTEIFIRDKMTWFQVMILVMFHLQHVSSGTAKQGFYHWRTHVVTFIDKKWQVLFPRDFRRKKNWMGTIAGFLSHFSPHFLTSGVKYLGESGWWRLTFPKLTPALTVKIYNELISNKRTTFKDINIESIKILIAKFAPNIDATEIQIEPQIKIEKHDTEYASFQTDDIDVTGDEFDFFKMEADNFLLHDYQMSQIFDQTSDLFSDLSSIKEIDSTFDSIPDPTPSLFQNAVNSNFYTFLETQTQNHPPPPPLNSTNVTPLRSIEEKALLNHIPKSPARISRLHRKLTLRQLKRNNGLKLFNIDNLMKPEMIKKPGEFDRFSHYSKTNTTFEEIRLASGNLELFDHILSPYTGRLLKPYIRRDFEPKSTWLRLMNELTQRVRGDEHQMPVTSLDYCYVRPNHIPAINYLCSQYFWPGIDMSEALEYPDFSCVVMYQKLVVGFAFMVPDVKFNETYISFIFTRPEWRRSGIATFMIYHLIQTCMGKEVTLHVAIDNPAIFLYQKFGFKVEEVALNFYDTYLREDSKKCRHAFFLRLDR